MGTKLTPSMVELWPLPEGVTAKVEHYRDVMDCVAAGIEVHTNFGMYAPKFATHVTLYRADVVDPIGEGWSYCSPHDSEPSRRVGHAIARNRALKNAAEMGYITRVRGTNQFVVADISEWLARRSKDHEWGNAIHQDEGMYVNLNP